MKCALISFSCVFLAIFALGLVVSAVQAARPKIIEGGPDPLGGTRSLGDILAERKHLHVIFVHGMRAEGPGASAAFIDRLRSEFGASSVKSSMIRMRIVLGEWPDKATVGEEQIWNSQTEWEGSQPFVDRTILTAMDGRSAIIDEVNWWPLLFPLKCRFLVVPEHDLSGNAKNDLRLCARRDPPFYPWISSSEAERLIASPPKSGGGVKVNSSLKRQILNWGIADAVILLGPMRHYINETMQQAFGHALGNDPDASEFVIVSESLGSFAVLDALANGMPNVREVFDRTFDLYFFANQFALLELGRVQGIPDGSVTKGMTGPTTSSIGPPSPLNALRSWATPVAEFTEKVDARERQIVAFSDPSDMLTYRVPPISGVKVVNLYDRNGTSFVVANPAKAHSGHVHNSAVWKVLLGRHFRK